MSQSEETINPKNPELSGYRKNGRYVKFCTECDADLDEFDFSPEANDKEAIRKRFNNCKKIGRFNGDFCSRVFISEPGNLEDVFKEEDDD